MNSLKAYSTLQTEQNSVQHPLSDKNTHPKMQAIIHNSVKLDKPLKYQMMIKKNYIARKISFSSNKSLLTSKRIINRNAKYLKKIKPYLDKFGGFAKSIQHSKGLEGLNMKYELDPIDSSNRILSNSIISGLENEGWQQYVRRQMIKTSAFYDKLAKRVISKNFHLKAFKCSAPVFCRAFSTKKLNELKTIHVFITINEAEPREVTEYSNVTQSDKVYRMLNDFAELQYLESINIEFGPNGKGIGFLLSIFQKLSPLENTLRALQIQINLVDSMKHSLKMKETMKKFSNLKRLALVLGLSVKAGGKIFNDLLPLPGLRSLSFKITNNNRDTELTGVASFVSALKDLTEFQFCCSDLHFDHYQPLWKAIEKLKNLESLSMKSAKRPRFLFLSSLFLISPILKIMRDLKRLRKLSITKYKNTLDPDEMLKLPKCLLNCPDLKDAKLYLCVDRHSRKKYDFNEEYYNDFKELVEKLEVLRIVLDSFPDDVAEKLEKILLRSGKKTSGRYSCVKYVESRIKETPREIY